MSKELLSEADPFTQSDQTVLVADPRLIQRNRLDELLTGKGYSTKVIRSHTELLQSRPLGADILLLHELLFEGSERVFPLCIDKNMHKVILITNSTEIQASTFGYDAVLNEPVDESKLIDSLYRIERERQYDRLMCAISNLLSIHAKIDSEYSQETEISEEEEVKLIIQNQIQDLLDQADDIEDKFGQQEYENVFARLDASPVPLVDD